MVKEEGPRDIVAIACYHLHGDENNTWHWMYDTGLRGVETHQTQSVSSTGKDLYVARDVLCLGTDIL